MTSDPESVTEQGYALPGDGFYLVMRNSDEKQIKLFAFQTTILIQDWPPQPVRRSTTSTLSGRARDQVRTVAAPIDERRAKNLPAMDSQPFD